MLLSLSIMGDTHDGRGEGRSHTLAYIHITSLLWGRHICNKQGRCLRSFSFYHNMHTHHLDAVGTKHFQQTGTLSAQFFLLTRHAVIYPPCCRDATFATDRDAVFAASHSNTTRMHITSMLWGRHICNTQGRCLGSSSFYHNMHSHHLHAVGTPHLQQTGTLSAQFFTSFKNLSRQILSSRAKHCVIYSRVGSFRVGGSASHINILKFVIYIYI